MEEYEQKWITIEAPLKSLTGVTRFWIPDLPYYDNRK